MEYDSRQVEPGALFIAIQGFKVDGAKFIPEAIKRGAVAIVSENEPESEPKVAWVVSPRTRLGLSDISAKFYNYPGKALKVCGITGTNGKTTCAMALKSILEARGKRVGLISSLGYDTGGETFSAERTTPESLELQRLLFLMRSNHCNNVVMEVSSHALELFRVENIEFRIGLFTNLTRDHLDFHKDMKSYFEAKALLLRKLDGPTRYAVINLDSPGLRDLFGRLKSSHLSYSVHDEKADVRVAGCEMNPSGNIFDLVTPLGTRTVRSKLCGKFNLSNVVGAAAAGLVSGVDLDAIVTGLEAQSPVPGRFQQVEAGQPFSVFIDYAHTPDAITGAIESAREFSSGRVIALFGCGGDRDTGKRALMGEAATKSADYTIVTSDNPRSEDPNKIIEDIKPGLEGDSYQICVDRSKAISAALKNANAEDIVLILGKGAEEFELVSNGKRIFSDYSETIKALADAGYHNQPARTR